VKDLSFARLRDRQASSAVLELKKPDLGRLVGLGVRPQGDAVFVGVGLESFEIRFELIEVDHDDRSLDLVERFASLACEEGERPLGACSCVCSAHAFGTCTLPLWRVFVKRQDQLTTTT
jgi:hypothetical protein